MESFLYTALTCWRTFFLLHGPKSHWTKQRNFFMLHAFFNDPANFEESGKILRNVGSKIVKRRLSDKYSFIGNHNFIYLWTAFHSILSFILFNVLMGVRLLISALWAVGETNHWRLVEEKWKIIFYQIGDFFQRCVRGFMQTCW